MRRRCRGSWSRAAIDLRDDQLMYVRMNPRSFTPFGLGPLEVAFETVNQFLSAHRFAGKLAANSVAQYALWLNEATPTQHDRLIRWWQDEIEGTGRVPLLSTEQKPEVLRFAQGTDADLRLAWQEFLIRMVANAFGLPPLLLGLEGDVNRSTAAELADEAFRGAISPLAQLLAGHITRDLFAKCVGWREFEFVFNELNARDEETELAVQVQLLQAGVLTVNEVRAMRGLGPLEADRRSGAHGAVGERGGNRSRARDLGTRDQGLRCWSLVERRSDATGSDGGEVSSCGRAPEPGGVRRGIDGGGRGQRQGSCGSTRAPGDVDAGSSGGGVTVAAGDGGGLSARVGRA